MTDIFLSAGKFSSDRTIAEYAREIWGMEPRWGEIFTSFFNRFFIFMGKRLSETFTFQHSKNVVLSLNMHCYLLHHISFTLRLLSWEKLPDPHGLSQGSKENSPE